MWFIKILTYCATLALPYLCTPTGESCLSFELSRQSPSVSNKFFDTLKRVARPAFIFDIESGSHLSDPSLHNHAIAGIGWIRRSRRIFCNWTYTKDRAAHSLLTGYVLLRHILYHTALPDRSASLYKRLLPQLPPRRESLRENHQAVQIMGW